MSPSEDAIDPTADPVRHRGRGVGVGVLIAVASILVVISVLAIWLNTVAFDTPTWRSTSKQLIQNPVIQTEVSQYLVGQLFTSPATQNDISGALPPALQRFEPAVSGGLQQIAVAASERLLATPAVQTLWVAANTQAHAQFVQLINNESKFTAVDNGRVVLDLHPMLLEVADQAGLGSVATRLLPATAGQLDIMDSAQLSNVQTAARILNAIALWAPLVTLALFVLAVWLARGFRRRALLWSAIGILLAAIVLVLVRRELGTEIIGALASNPSVRPALIEAWYIGTQVLGTINETLLVGAIVLLIGVWIAGTGRIPSAVRNRLAPWIVNPIYAFGIPAVLLVILIVWAPLPIFQKLVPVIIIAVLAALGIEALRRLTIAERSEIPSP